MTYQTRYETLNQQQRRAVDTLDGPVMVIAGPGTGKTELLSMRAAAILQQTDTLPENILLLTFTESGARAMRQRLESIIGKDAYKVAVFTFHGFASEVINQNGSHFYRGAEFQAADELKSFEILEQIFTSLDHTSPLASNMNGEFTYLPEVRTVISELKRNGFTSDELLDVLARNDVAIDAVTRPLSDIFSGRVSKQTASQLEPLLSLLEQVDDQQALATLEPLSALLAASLRRAIDEAEATGSTKPVTAWRNQWLKKNADGEFALKASERASKLRDVAYVYYRYMAAMEQASLYDFDDMILQLVHALEHDPELRYNLQEQYQYVMVDEFQDTNLAQLRILLNLLDNPVHEGRPNVLIVGDDDQAIYAFQGADVSNMLTFQSLYDGVDMIVLTDNYRSTGAVLESARRVITQGSDRLETTLAGLSKVLTPHSQVESVPVQLTRYETAADEAFALVESVSKQLAAGTAPSEIAVIARRHSELVRLLPYFSHAGVAVSYEKQDNALDLPSIVALQQLARCVTLFAANRHDEAQALLPDVLSHPMWQLDPALLWKLSLHAYEHGTSWVDAMKTFPDTALLAEWFVAVVAQARHANLETSLDTLIGVESLAGYTSPFFAHYFSETAQAEQPADYVMHLEALRTIRAKLRDHSDQEATLEAFVSFIDLHRKTHTTVSVTTTRGSDSGVQLMTAHRSKGLEFDVVYLPGIVDGMWGEKARSRSRMIGYPENLPLIPAGDTLSERLRLFYVGMTRARQRLYISHSNELDNGKAASGSSFLADEPWQTGSISDIPALERAQLLWNEPVYTDTATLQELLAPTLDRFKLSATALNSFVDLPSGGPQHFLTQNLLHFPRGVMPHAAYGTAVHEVLQHAHNHFVVQGSTKPLEDSLKDFEHAMARQRFSSAEEREQFTTRGAQALTTFLASDQAVFTRSQKVELSFAGQGVELDGARLSGKLDLVDIDASEKTVRITDYKTGTAALSWTGKADYQKVKLHKYRQQLMFYELLVRHSRSYAGYDLRALELLFVEPTPSGAVRSLRADYTPADLEQFQRLVVAVWRKITTLDLPDTSAYEPSYKGILAFEADLVDGKV